MTLKFKRILHVVLAAQALPLLCGLSIVVALQLVIVSTDHSTKNEEKARVALKSCAGAQKQLMRAVFSLMLYTTSGLESDLEGYNRSRPEMDRISVELSELSQVYPQDKQIIGQLQTLAQGFRSRGEQMVILHKLGAPFCQQRFNELYAEAEAGIGQWGLLSQKLHEAITADLAMSPVSSRSYLTTLSRILMVGLLGVFLSCLINARLLTAYIDRRLNVVSANSENLGQGNPLLSPLSGSDEIATLDREFHSMARAISEATRREREILENASDIIVTVDQLLTIRSANAACVRLWGREAQLDNKNITDLTSSPIGEKLRAFFAAARRTGEASTMEMPMQRGDTSVFASISAQWSPENALFSCVVHDITERKRAEDTVRETEMRLRAMLEKMPAGLLLVDQHGTVTGFNQAAAHLLGAPGQLIGKNVADLLPTGTIDKEEGWLHDCQNQHRLLSVGPGSQTHVEIDVEKLPGEGADNFLIVLLDISASQKLESLRHQLIDGISQTIVAPLDSIHHVLARLSTSAASLGEDRFSTFLSTATAESDRLLKLFSDLLEIESSHVQQLSVHPRDVALQAIMQRALEAVRVAADKKGLNLSAQPTDVHVQADPDRLIQVLINLVFNALKFTPSGGNIKLEAEALPDSQVEVRVRDSGCGIPAGMEEKIFEPFKQTKVSDALNKGGSGLGLFICKSLVEKHGGTIGAYNHEAGAVFYVRLPQATGIPSFVDVTKHS